MKGRPIRGRVAARVLAALLGAALLAQAWTANNRWQASRIAATVERLSVRATGLGQVPTRLIESNLERLREAEKRDPTNVSLPLLRGSQYLLLGRPQPALRAYDRALEVEPRAELYLNRGRALRLAGDEDAAEASFRTALILDPTLSPEVRRYLLTRERQRRVQDRLRRELGLEEDGAAEPGADPSSLLYDDFEPRHLRRWDTRQRVDEGDPT